MAIYGVRMYRKPLRKPKMWKKILVAAIVLFIAWAVVARMFEIWDHDYEMMNEGVSYHALM